MDATKRQTLIVLILALSLAATSLVQAEETEELTVFCGAGLMGAFTEIGDLYQNLTGIEVKFNFDGIPSLRAQIEQGAYADVVVSADLKHMNAMRAEGLLDNSTVTIFTHNKMAIVVPNDNPANIRSLEDLARPGVMIVMGTKELPAGDYALQVLDKLAADPNFGPEYREKVLENMVSEETTVNRVVSKVALGEADAGFAFISDVSPQMVGKVTRIPVPDEYNVVGDFPIGVLKQSEHPEEARNFIEVVMSEDGQSFIAKYGFIPVKTQ